MNDSGVAVRPHRDGIALVFHPVIWIFMPRDGEAAGPPLKPTVAYPHPAYPITAAPRKMHKKGLKLIRNLSRLRMQMLCISIAVSACAWPRHGPRDCNAFT